MSWKESEVALLKELWGRRSARMIALEVGKTKNAVIGKAHRIGLEKLPSPIKINPIKPEKIYVEAKRGKCQWIDGEPVFRRTSDEGKCLKPTVYRDSGEKSSYCLKHTKVAWRKAKVKV